MSAVRDAQSMFDAYKSDFTAISTDTNTDGPAFDTKDHEMGTTFLIACVAYTDGDYELVPQESDDGSTGWTDIDAASLLPQPGTTAVSVGALTADGAVMGKLGCFSTKRYVRARVTSTGTTSGASIFTAIIKHGEYLPL